MTRFKLLAITLFAGLACALAGAQPANAASPQDDWLVMTDNTTVTTTIDGSVTCDPTDVALRLFNIADDLVVREPWQADLVQGMKDITNGTITGQWYMSIREVNGEQFPTMGFYEQNTANPNKIIFDTSNAYPDIWKVIKVDRNGNTGFHASFDIVYEDSNCQNIRFDGPTNQDLISAYGYVKHVYAAGFDEEYPTDYEGEEIRESLSTPVVSDFSPDWYVSSIVSYKGLAHDSNFNTFDGIEWTCSEDGNSLIEGGEGLAPVLYWQVYNSKQTPEHDDDVLLYDGYHNATAQVELNLPEIDKPQQYRITGWYDCGGSVEFEYPSHAFFDVTANGMLDESAKFEECFSDEFPFIHINSCLNNLVMFASIASFGDMNWGKDWESGQACHTFGTLGNWLNLNSTNRTVCPQVSHEVRAIITPFVTFLLGLLVFKFIANQSRRDW